MLDSLPCLHFPVEIPNEILPAATAVYIADIMGKQSMFWGIVLSYDTPPTFNAAGGIAVRQFVEIILTNLGPVEIFKRIKPVLLDPTAGWESLGLMSITDEFVGAPLTMEMKYDLINILNQSATDFIECVIKDLTISIGRVDFGYGYGYGLGDLSKTTFGYGYGVSYDTLDYFDVLTFIGN